MEINIKTARQVSIVEIVGELDAKTAPQVEEHVLPLVQPGGRILVDMGKVSYMSSSGLRIFLLLNRKVSTSDARLALIGLTENITDTMEMTGFLAHFATYRTLQSGLEALSD